MDANKVTMYEKGQTVDPITLHKENDSDGWPQWPAENQSSEVAPWTAVALPVNRTLNHFMIYII